MKISTNGTATTFLANPVLSSSIDFIQQPKHHTKRLEVILLNRLFVFHYNWIIINCGGFLSNHDYTL